MDKGLGLAGSGLFWPFREAQSRRSQEEAQPLQIYAELGSHHSNAVCTCVSKSATFDCQPCHAYMAYRLTAATPASITESMRRQLRDNEIRIAQQMKAMDDQKAEVEMALQQANTAQQTDNNPSGTPGQLREQLDTLSLSRKSLEYLVSQSHQLRTGQKFTKVAVSDGGKLLAGLINYESDIEAQQEFHEINVTGSGSASLGVGKNADGNSFFSTD